MQYVYINTQTLQDETLQEATTGLMTKYPQALVVATFENKTSHKSKPTFELLLSNTVKGDTVIVPNIHQLGDTVSEVVDTWQQLRSKQVKLHIEEFDSYSVTPANAEIVFSSFRVLSGLGEGQSKPESKMRVAKRPTLITDRDKAAKNIKTTQPRTRKSTRARVAEAKDLYYQGYTKAQASVKADVAVATMIKYWEEV